MPRLPQPGADAGSWGDILNDFLAQAHNSDGTLKSGSVSTAALPDATVTEQKLSTAVQTKSIPLRRLRAWQGRRALSHSSRTMLA